MKQMALSRKLFICCGIALLIILIFLAYSIKTHKEENSEKIAVVSVRADELNRLRQENNELKRLKRENEELKRTLAEIKLQNSAINASPDNITKEAQGPKRPPEETRKNDEKTEPLNVTLNETNPTKSGYDKNRIDSLLSQFSSSTDANEKVKLLESLSKMSMNHDPAVIKAIEDALDDPDPEMGSTAIQLLEGYNTTEILPVISKALAVGSEETRMAALEYLPNVDSPLVSDVLNQALDDTSDTVREAAFDKLEGRPDSEQLPILKYALTSPYEDVKTQAIQKLEDRSDHKAVEILIEGLKDNNPDFRSQVNSSLSNLLDKEFNSYKEAKDWWNQNKNKYDAELSEIDEGK